MSITLSKIRLQAFIDSLIDLSKGNYSVRLSESFIGDDFSSAEVVFNMLAEEYENNLKYFISLQPGVGYEYVTSSITKLSHEGKILDISLIHTMDDRLDKFDFIGRLALDLIVEKDQDKWLKNFLMFLQSPAKRNSFALHLSINGKVILGHCAFHFMGVSREVWMSFAIIGPIAHDKPAIDLKKYMSEMGIDLEDQSKIQKIRNLLANNDYQKIYSLEELSVDFKISKSALQKGFKLLYHETFYHFYIKERIRYAKELLIYSNLSIKAISDICGFTNYSNFFRNFHKLVQISPADFRKLYKNEKLNPI
ncbi:helix-turn-helix domain-containing protein [Flavobacterium sp. JP2137]|uniref:helix-turn-helix domain-containing protein n=1 Tax=Flavobacterium sp. JP2137 TaxID=3414510 RepID=UPI003D300E55